MWNPSSGVYRTLAHPMDGQSTLDGTSPEKNMGLRYNSTDEVQQQTTLCTATSDLRKGQAPTEVYVIALNCSTIGAIRDMTPKPRRRPVLH